MASTYFCIGGPKAGMYLTQIEAGKDYYPFNSATGEHYPDFWIHNNRLNKTVPVSPTHRTVKKYFQKNKVSAFVPKCVLIYCERPADITIEID